MYFPKLSMMRTPGWVLLLFSFTTRIPGKIKIRMNCVIFSINNVHINRVEYEYAVNLSM